LQQQRSRSFATEGRGKGRDALTFSGGDRPPMGVPWLAVQLLLITGIPGTGKTTLGNYLAEHHGFQHLDFEDMPTRGSALQGRERGLKDYVAGIKHRNADTVITWGFVPRFQLQFVQIVRKLGFEWIWFGGDEEAAHRVFTERATVGEDAWQAQLEAIATYIDLDKLKLRIINPFDASGAFRPLSEIAAEVIKG
jgi:hypothetical protein